MCTRRNHTHAMRSYGRRVHKYVQDSRRRDRHVCTYAEPPDSKPETDIETLNLLYTKFLAEARPHRTLHEIKPVL